jgi:hypothetical protein
MAHPALATVALALACSLTACAPYPLHSRMTDSEIRATLDRTFTSGMSTEQVRDELVKLRVPTGRQMRYEPTPERPEVLLARIYPAGGAWVGGGDQTLEFVDVSFVFEPTNSLARWPIYRDGARYLNGGLAYGPSRAPMRHARDFPANLPPPADPLEGVK